MERKFNVSETIIKRITFFFTEHESSLEISNNLEMSYLLRILPTNLKTQLAVFLYKDAIKTIRFLQHRKKSFYEVFLDKLKPMRFDRNMIIFEKGSKANEVCLIMSGVVLNESTGRLFTAGSMFGEQDVYFGRERKDTYKANT